MEIIDIIFIVIICNIKFLEDDLLYISNNVINDSSIHSYDSIEKNKGKKYA